MTEETKNAAMSGSIGIVMAIGVSAVLGWFLILGLLFSIQDYDALVAGDREPVAQILLDCVGENGAIVLMVRQYSFRPVTLADDLGTGNHCRVHVFLRNFLDHVEFEDDVCVCERWGDSGA